MAESCSAMWPFTLYHNESESNHDKMNHVQDVLKASSVSASTSSTKSSLFSFTLLSSAMHVSIKRSHDGTNSSLVYVPRAGSAAWWSGHGTQFWLSTESSEKFCEVRTMLDDMGVDIWAEDWDAACRCDDNPLVWQLSWWVLLTCWECLQGEKALLQPWHWTYKVLMVRENRGQWVFILKYTGTQTLNFGIKHHIPLCWSANHPCHFLLHFHISIHSFLFVLYHLPMLPACAKLAILVHFNRVEQCFIGLLYACKCHWPSVHWRTTHHQPDPSSK